MKNLKHAFITISALCLTACSTMSKKDCETANWAALGKRDGVEGKTLDAYNRRETQCQEHGLLTEREKYISGYAEGLKIFCTYEGGQKFGYSGDRYDGQCRRHSEEEFLKGYKLGKAEAERDAYARQLEDEQRAHQERLDQERRDREEELKRQREELERQQNL